VHIHTFVCHSMLRHAQKTAGRNRQYCICASRSSHCAALTNFHLGTFVSHNAMRPAAPTCLLTETEAWAHPHGHSHTSLNHHNWILCAYSIHTVSHGYIPACSDFLKATHSSHIASCVPHKLGKCMTRRPLVVTAILANMVPSTPRTSACKYSRATHAWLQWYCPETGPRNSPMMWLWVALLTGSSPVLITLTQVTIIVGVRMRARAFYVS